MSKRSLALDLSVPEGLEVLYKISVTSPARPSDSRPRRSTTGRS